VAVDPAEIHDLAEAEPDRLADMVDRWWVEARANQVLPLDNRILHIINNPKPDRRRPRLTSTYYPGTSPVPEFNAANVKNRGHSIDVDVTIPESGPVEGVLLAQGSSLGGFTLHLIDGRLRYIHNLYGRDRHVLMADMPVPSGAHRLGFRFDREEGGRGGGPMRLTVDGDTVAEGIIPTFTINSFSLTGAGLTCGYELGPPIGTDYDAPFRSTVTIHRAIVTLDEHAPINPSVEFERIMSEQ
jgi:arylsulfatase